MLLLEVAVLNLSFRPLGHLIHTFVFPTLYRLMTPISALHQVAVLTFDLHGPLPVGN